MTLLADAPVDGYDALAEHYDALTAHHDHRAFAGTYDRFLRRHGAPGDRLLDVGCGTASSTLALRRLGWQVAGVDAASAMVAAARRKAPGVPFWAADMRALPAAAGTFDVVTCVDDGVNCLEGPGELAAMVASAADRLSPGGLLVFDVNTLRTYRGLFASHQVLERSGRVFAWRGRASREFQAGDRATLELDVFAARPDGTWSRTSTRHIQRHFSPTGVEQALSTGGLTHAATYGVSEDGTVSDQLDERIHHKALYIARKPAGPKAGKEVRPC